MIPPLAYLLYGDEIKATLTAWIEDPTSSAPAAITGAQAIAMVESTMAARDWSPELANPLLDQLDELPGFASEEEPSPAWWHAAGSLLEGYQYHLDGAEKLGYAFRNRAGQAVNERERASERSLTGIVRGAAQATTDDLKDASEKIGKNRGAIAVGLGLALGVVALLRLR